jgi:alpha-ketoglutarate-dependent taurine dioxygenase
MMLTAEFYSAIRNETNRIGADFLKIDSEVGLIFSSMALKADDEENKRRTTGVARRAHDSIMRFRQQVELTDAETIELDRNLLRLKGQLQILGEAF